MTPSPAITLVTPSDLVIDRSACVVTVVEALELLLPGVGSVVEEPTVAVLLIVLPFAAAGSTVALMMTTCELEAAMSPSAIVFEFGHGVSGVQVPLGTTQ